MQVRSVISATKLSTICFGISHNYDQKSGLAPNRTRPLISNRIRKHIAYGAEVGYCGGGCMIGVEPGLGPHSFTNSESVLPLGWLIS